MAASREALAAVLRVRAQCLSGLFEELSQQAFPQQYLADAPEVPIAAAADLATKIPALLGPTTDDVVRAAQERQLKRYGVLVEELHSVAEFLESSDVLAIPASMYFYLSDALEPLLADRRLVLRADSEFNYSFDPLARALNRSLKVSGLAVKPLPEPLALFKFPSATRNDGLLHSILAHESGHFLDEYLNLTTNLLTSATAVSGIATRIGAGLSLGTSVSDLLVLSRARLVLENWIKELVADLIGVHLLGPAGALSLVEFMQFEQDQNDLQTSHPPTLMRFNLMESELSHLGWMKDVLTPRGLWDSYPVFAAPALTAVTPLDRRLASLVAIEMPALFPDVQASVRTLFGTRSYDPGTFLTDEPFMRQLLELHVPPAEVLTSEGKSQPIAPESIINGCWLFWSERCPGWEGAATAPYESRMQIGRLMFKALEISRIRKIMK